MSDQSVTVIEIHIKARHVKCPLPGTIRRSYKFLERKHRSRKGSVFMALDFLEKVLGTSLVVQWLRICLPMQGTWVRALVREDPTCRGAIKPVHNY